MGLVRFAAALVLLVGSSPALAQAEAEEGTERREMTQTEIEGWLEKDDTRPRDIGTVEEPEEVPPLPPRHHGFVIESSIGALGHIGPLKNVSPTSPWFHLQFGYEPVGFLMVFAEGDLAFSNTSYANPPPEPRAYALYGGGGGLRFTVKLTERVGLYGQGSFGFARINEDVLFVYGYRSADSWGLYYGGSLGLEWYQVNPHTALAMHAGLRNYDETLGRERSNEVALAWTFGLAIRYVF